jgi:hypothetical protein
MRPLIADESLRARVFGWQMLEKKHRRYSPTVNSARLAKDVKIGKEGVNYMRANRPLYVGRYFKYNITTAVGRQHP